MHENLDRDEDITAGTEKSFGIVFAVLFLVIAAWPLLDGANIRLWAIVVAGLFLLAGFAFPIVLRPLNVLWFKFAMLLYKVVNPLTMAMLYYFTVVPTGLIMRLLGKDPLQRSFDKTIESYWVTRTPPGPEPASMKNQF